MTDILTATLDMTYCLAVIGVVKSLKYVLFSFPLLTVRSSFPLKKHRHQKKTDRPLRHVSIFRRVFNRRCFDTRFRIPVIFIHFLKALFIPLRRFADCGDIINIMIDIRFHESGDFSAFDRCDCDVSRFAALHALRKALFKRNDAIKLPCRNLTFPFCFTDRTDVDILDPLQKSLVSSAIRPPS